jgi:hypothetical protein
MPRDRFINCLLFRLPRQPQRPTARAV